jgi:hypothetical protein
MSFTVQNLIDLAAKDLGVLASGESLQPEEYTDALNKLNALLDSWDAMKLNIFAINRNQYALTSGTGSYTLGPSGTLTSTRPIAIVAANVIASNFSTPMRLISKDEYNAIPNKTDTSIAPKVLYSDNDYPLTTIYVQPLPSGTPELELYTWEPMPQFNATSAAFAMPPGYQRALEFALAIDMAAMFGRQVDPIALAGVAAKAEAAMKGLASLPPSPGLAQEAQARAIAASMGIPPAPAQQQ